MKKFCESLREHAMEINILKKKNMKLLTKEQQESYDNAETCYICKKKIENKYHCVRSVRIWSYSGLHLPHLD